MVSDLEMDSKREIGISHGLASDDMMASDDITESDNKDISIGSSGSRDQPAFFSNSENNYKLKVVLIGDINVGKTSIAARFSLNKFEEKYKQTIGASFVSKIAMVKSDVIHFQVWDTAGQERYKSLVPMYLRGAHIAFVVYDITDPKSFEHIGIWLKALQQHCDTATTVLVANKCDLQSVVNESMALTYAEEHGLQLVTVSAKSGHNVERLFHSTGSKVVDKLKSQTVTSARDRNSRLYTGNQPVQIEKSDTDTTDKKKKCCKA